MNHKKTTALLATTLILPFASLHAAPQDAAANKAEKAAAAADAILKKLPSIPGLADAKVINIHIGDNITFGFDEGVDAEEWGMTENNNATDATGAKPNPASSPAAPSDRPNAFRKIDFRKGDLVLVATEDPVKEPASEKTAAAPVVEAAPAAAVATPTVETTAP
ncbi:MAG: hypothetical protein ACKOLA_01575 [Spartobacteria bacterium]